VSHKSLASRRFVHNAKCAHVRPQGAHDSRYDVSAKPVKIGEPLQTPLHCTKDAQVAPQTVLVGRSFLAFGLRERRERHLLDHDHTLCETVTRRVRDDSDPAWAYVGSPAVTGTGAAQTDPPNVRRSVTPGPLQSLVRSTHSASANPIKRRRARAHLPESAPRPLGAHTLLAARDGRCSTLDADRWEWQR
jgi:hypothetical protein